VRHHSYRLAIEILSASLAVVVVEAEGAVMVIRVLEEVEK
jgi:hypothetical protein